MSFRPTIAVRYGSRIADIMYCKNWEEHYLIIEAVALAAAYEDCRSVEEYRERAFGRQDINYIIRPVLLPNSQRNLKSLEACSELPVNVDLKAGYIYCSYGSLSKKLLRFRRRARLDRRGVWQTDFYKELDSGVIELSKLDLEGIRRMILDDPELQCCVSDRTLRALIKKDCA